MLLIQQVKCPIGHSKEDLQKKIASVLRVPVNSVSRFSILRKSIDARKKPELCYSYSIVVEHPNEKAILAHNKNSNINLYKPVTYEFSTGILSERKDRPIIVGSGPAGLFCAYTLAKAGLCPIVLERGKEVEKRQQDVSLFWETGKLNPESNVQFGEGGAGTFSDGKLNTLVKDKDGRNQAVLRTFVEFGAREDILYDSKPHIGTDILAKIIYNMRNHIITLGGEFRFESKVTDFLIADHIIKGVVINHKEELYSSDVVLALGHSARDTFEKLYEHAFDMDAKSFAVGFRVQHPQDMINLAQYGEKYARKLPAAPYKLTAQTANGRGVYSFCMCPGGYVVNASSEEGRLVVNGMSYSDRNSQSANSAIIVAVTPEDFGFKHPLAGIAFQRKLEEKAFRAGNGKIPVQYFSDFEKSYWKKEAYLDHKSLGYSCHKGLVEFANLTEILPSSCNDSFLEAMHSYDRIIPGFDKESCLLSGVESRTSSPVRITRDDSLQANVKGVYPCGEGAGYAGGIMSAAMDGIRVGNSIIEKLLS